MAVTKTHPIKSTLKAAIEYICNPDKTDGKLLVFSYGCTAETADIEFSWTRSHAIDKGSNLGRHLIQAFEPGEVTPGEAHEIGMQLASEILSGKYEFVLATHIDKEHVHNHLIFNAVSFTDYRHYHSNKRSYHEIRRVSDRLCREHGLSVIEPGPDKGKTYPEHQAGSYSYKAQLRAAIDRLIPISADLADLMSRLQQEGYEIKQGKYFSCKAPEQLRFTRLKTLGIDYTEDAISSRIRGGSRPSKRVAQAAPVIQKMIDVNAKNSPAFAHWAKLKNLKAAARTLDFLTQHGVGSYEELQTRIALLKQKRDGALASVKDAEHRLSDLNVLQKHAATYRQLKPVYTAYSKSKDKEKFLRGHEGEIIVFEAAYRELKKLHAEPLPSPEHSQAQHDTLTAEKDAAYKEYRTAQKELRDYQTLLQNVDQLLATNEPKNKKEEHELS